MGLEWDDPRDVKARAAEKKLWDAHQREWLGPLAGYLTTPWCERGLLCGCLTVRTFAGRPFAEAARCEAWAWLERVYMAVSDATAAQLAACPLLRDLTWVRLYSQGRFGRAGAVKLTASPHLTGLHTLSLGFACDAGMVEVLLAHRGLASLWDLSFRKCKLGDDGARAVAAAAHLSGLRRLDLRYNRISSPGAAALVAASHLSGLELLDLRNNPLGEAASEQVRQRFGDRVLL
jgi:hypothetical protein